MNLLAVSNDTKTVKGEAKGYLTGILYLQPFTLSGRNLCPRASAGCAAACLNTAGRGTMDNVQAGRARKTAEFFDLRDQFWVDLRRDLRALVRKANREGLRPLARLNGTSDIRWELYPEWTDIRNEFHAAGGRFYDYTKFLPAERNLRDRAGYHLTFSRSEDTTFEQVQQVVRTGWNVAVVFSADAHAHVMRAGHWRGIPVIDGDESDVRVDDPTSVIVALKAKGKAKRDESGFTVNLSDC